MDISLWWPTVAGDIRHSQRLWFHENRDAFGDKTVPLSYLW